MRGWEATQKDEGPAVIGGVEERDLAASEYLAFAEALKRAMARKTVAARSTAGLGGEGDGDAVRELGDFEECGMGRWMGEVGGDRADRERFEWEDDVDYWE